MRKVAVLDDDPGSLSKHQEFLAAHGYDLVSKKTVESFGSLVEDPSAIDEIDAFILDMHIRGTPDLSGLDLEDVNTKQSKSVGLAVAQAYLIGKLNIRNKPIMIVSGFTIPKTDRARIQSLKGQDLEIEVFSKTDDFAKFKEYFLSKLDGLSALEKPLDEAVQPMAVTSFIREGVEVVDEIFNDWDFSWSERAAAFGFIGIDTKVGWRETKKKIMAFPSNIIASHIRLLCKIKWSLEALLQGDQKAEQEWMRETLKVLLNQSASELICAGDQRKLVFLLSTISRATG